MQGGRRSASGLIKLMCRSNRSQSRSSSKKDPTTNGTTEQLIADNKVQPTPGITDPTNSIQQPETNSQTSQEATGLSQESNRQNNSNPSITAEKAGEQPSELNKEPANASTIEKTAEEPLPVEKNLMPTTDNMMPLTVATIDKNNNKEELSPALIVAPSVTSNLTSGPPIKVVVSPVRGPILVLQDTKGATVVYTDASVKNKQAGIGVYFGERHPLNMSKALPGYSNDVGNAEIIAAKMALQSLRGWSRFDNGPVILRTDNYAIVEAMQVEYPIGKHAEEFRELRKLALSFPKGVQFEHVYAHNGEPGNEAADKLAYEAVSRTAHQRRSRSRQPSPKMLRRTRTSYVSGKHKHKKHANKKQEQVSSESAPSDTEVLAICPPVVEKRNAKQHILNALTKGKVLTNKPLELDGTQESSSGEDKKPVNTRANLSKARLLSGIKVSLKAHLKTPPTSKNSKIDGRPITWAPKKKVAVSKLSTNSKDPYQTKIDRAEKKYTMAKKKDELITAVEDLSGDENKASAFRKSWRQRRSSKKNNSKAKQGTEQQSSSASFEGDENNNNNGNNKSVTGKRSRKSSNNSRMNKSRRR